MKKTLTLFGAGILSLTAFFAPALSVSAAGSPEVEIKETNWSGGFEFSAINEAKNTIKGIFTGATNPYDPEYQLLKYHFFWGDIRDEDLPEMVEGTKEGIVSFAKGDDGEVLFPRSHMQVEFTATEGVKLTDNTDKIISYAVYLKSRVDGISDKIVAGRYDYSGCVNSVGYSATDTDVFCMRDEYYGGKSYYTAMKDWRPLEPLPKTEVEYIEKTVEVPTVVEKIVEKIEYVTKEVPIEVAKEVVRTEYLAQVMDAAAEVIPEAVQESDALTEVNLGDTVSTDAATTSEGVSAEDEVEVPELGGDAKSSHMGWLLGLMGLIAIGGLGLIFWFVLPLVMPKKHKSHKKSE